jgi:hypothetical protein
MDLTTYNKILPINKSDKHNNYGIRFDINEVNSTPTQYYNSGSFTGEDTSLDDKSAKYFQDAYQNPSIENNILNCHKYYKIQNFLSYARTLPHYNEHILDIHKRIKNGEKFIVNGFNESFKFGKKKNKFHNFINDEANRIKEFQDKVNKARDAELKKHKENQNKQNQFPRLHFSSTKEIDTFAEYCEVRSRWSYDSEDEFANTRLDARKRALEETEEHDGACYDYSSEVQRYKFDDPSAKVFNNCYGTALDRQLHEELCETRAEMQDLELVDVNNIHVVAFAPIVYQATAQAKTEKNAIKAFTLSDFACDLVRVVKGGIRIMTLVNDPSIAARGIASGVKTFLTPQHWIDFVSGTLKLITLFVDEDGRQDSLNNSCITSAILGKPDLFLEECDVYVQHCQAQKKALRLEINKTAAKLKKMSDEELIEGGFKHGTIFVLDLMAFNAAALATTYEGRVLVSQYAEALTSPVAEEVVFEAAGVGKLSLEEGIDAVNMAIEVVEKNPKLLSQGESITQVMQDVANDLKGIEVVKKIKQWEKLSVEQLKKIGPKSKQYDIRAVQGDASDALDFFKAQVENFREVQPGVFVGTDSNGITFSYRATSLSGPPTIDVNGISGLRKIKFLELINE